MKCRICGKIVPTSSVQDAWYVGLRITVVSLHMGANGKPCSGSGTPPKK
jgi:hypothetical protein